MDFSPAREFYLFFAKYRQSVEILVCFEFILDAKDSESVKKNGEDILLAILVFLIKLLDSSINRSVLALTDLFGWPAIRSRYQLAIKCYCESFQKKP